MTRIALIAAMAQQRVIGLEQGMPWHMPADLAYFKQKTIAKPVVMGRKTFDCLGKPLPDRRNIVITRNLDWHADGVEVYHDLSSALKELEGEPEIMITGGETIYRQALPVATDLYLTFIDAAVKGDTYFPNWDRDCWQLVSEEQFQADSVNPYDYCFTHWQRKEGN